MKFNRKVSQNTIEQVQLEPFNVLKGKYDNVYITFVAHPKEKETEAWEDNGDSFLWLVLPEEKITTAFMKAALLKELERLHWLDYPQIREFVAERLSFSDMLSSGCPE